MLRRSLPRQLASPTPDHASDAVPSEGLADLQRTLGNAALQELLAGGGHLLAAFPHAATLARRLGQPLPGQARVDPEACAARGVEAFTEGATTVFRTATPPLKVAAHEAAHQLHHAGRARDAGLGAEGHAEAVARTVVAGEDARALLGTGDRVAGAFHPYTVLQPEAQGAGSAIGWRAPGGGALRIADDGTLAVGGDESGRTQDAWATPAQIQASNAVLTAQGSAVRLAVGAAELRGKAPLDSATGTERALHRVVVSDAEGGPATLTGDCGAAAHEVMGSHRGGRIASAVVRDGLGAEEATDPHLYVRDSETVEAGVTELWFREILRRAFGDSPVPELIATWQALTPEARDALEARFGLNQHAAPEVGEAVTILSLWDSPSWQQSPGQDAEDAYNWHFAACILRSGGDYVTLESFAGQAPDGWYFSMFGPASADQSFYELERTTEAFGTENVSLVVQPTTAARITVRLSEAADVVGDSEVIVTLASRLGAEVSEAVPAVPGEEVAVTLPLARLLAPSESEPLQVTVSEADLWQDDLLLTVPWLPPFVPASYARDGVEITGEMVP